MQEKKMIFISRRFTFHYEIMLETIDKTHFVYIAYQ